MLEESTKLPSSWKKTFMTLWFGCFTTGLGFSMTMPFLSLYISEIGNYSRWELNVYSGIGFAITYLSQAVISPYWGVLADRKGRKLMCLRASGVMAITVFATGLAQSVWVIITLRMIQGLFSGYINNATAFIAGETPKSKSGSTMTAMMTATVTGNLIGPLVGGTLAGYFGYRIPFFIMGIGMALVFLLTLVNTKEHFKTIKKDKMKPAIDLIKQFKNKRLIIVLFLTTLLVQASLMSISPIISLLVQELMNHKGNISFVSGIVAATPGFGTLIIARYAGHKMDSIGPVKVLLIGLIVASIVFIPMYLTTSPFELAGWRFILGIATTALLPAVQTALTVNSPSESFGRMFSYNQSFQAIGGVLGPLLGSAISSIFDYRDVFLFTASLLIINLILVIWANNFFKRDRRKHAS